MVEDKINSNESEGAFNDFIEDRIDEMVDEILNDGNFDHFGDRNSDIIVDADDIIPPTFTYGEGGGGQGQGQGPGKEGGGKIKFGIPYKRFMELIASKLNLPDLTKEGNGKIKEISYAYKTFGPTGILLDKKRTFKRALRSSIATGLYRPQENKWDVSIRRKDRRFKIPERVENPKYKAVVFYMGDISYSTFGERLEMEKRLVNFIQSWLDYNYGSNNVEHRFIVHDMQAYEVQPDEFYQVSNIGGTQASIAFDLVYQLAFHEYSVSSTNFYAFYFGDGEVFGNDSKEIIEILTELMCPVFNRIGVTEVLPGRWSRLNQDLSKDFSNHQKVRLSKIQSNSQTIDVIKALFGEHK
ncbi:MAG: DUF444 family protein [Deltaproteobacteria bacterium]|nr:DUF444 family protein [Deltaproteobacteria bacterium]MBT4525860.1 DUF444 family protein [Deltaproteobacteria bacterium]